MVATPYTGQGVDIALVCGAVSLATKQFYHVKLDNSGNVVICGVAAEKAIGILQNAPAIGEAALVRVFGPSKAVAGGTITLSGMTLVTTDNAGKVVAATTGGFPSGVALMPSSASDIITVMVNLGYVGIA